MSVTLEQASPDSDREAVDRSKALKQRRRRQSSLTAQGEPLVWLSGVSLTICLVMIVSLLGLVIYQGGMTFWPRSIVHIDTKAGQAFLGEVMESEVYVPDPQVMDTMSRTEQAELEQEMEGQQGQARRRLLRTENYEFTSTHFDWIDEANVRAEHTPAWAFVVERTAKGRFYGIPRSFLVDGEEQATGPEATWKSFQEHHVEVQKRVERIHGLEREDLGDLNARLEDERLELRATELKHGLDSDPWRKRQLIHDAVEADAQADYQRITTEISALRAINNNYQVAFEMADGEQTRLTLAEVVRAVPSNQLDFAGKLDVYASRWWEFLTAEPREANSEGGVWPAIFGTVIMTLIMSVLVVPIGVLAALYLREYAKQGVLVSFVRIAVNNLAGVPSIVFGVFGLGFFCYIVGTSVDELFFSASLPNPTYGKGGVLWASLTLALLTLPVVIVATEEALSAVPNSMREGSYACGATKWQTIRRIVLQRARPGILTGAILAIARGAGEVAPLMLVGAVKLAPELPVDLAHFPYIFPERSFMHLGFHIYDVGFQSQNSEAAKPMVYTTTLLLIAIVVMLNLVAIWIRARLRSSFQGPK
ncbi:MAG: phosphate transport system permease protein [Planctomycetota bacterium]|jgi:phosphate transport system permease protein